ncbi:hypothetical protein ACEWY4_007546 [Coilia grayii]|uniref:Integrase zinc-binding domain-containing protein n=1 Tax=Coilia grayii TaxID=363190 RepID=A0ABD1KGK1_9TELE
MRCCHGCRHYSRAKDREGGRKERMPPSAKGQLFYTGPSYQYMRLVVMSDEQRQAVLKECHNNPGTGNHGGVRATMDRVVAGYYWDTIKADVADWEEQVEVEELPSILNDMYQAQYLVTNSPGLFTGQVQEPRYLVMDHQDQMTALRLLKEDTEWDAKEPFIFMFQNAVDLETFMVICRDTLDMRVLAGYGMHIHPDEVCL